MIDRGIEALLPAVPGTARPIPPFALAADLVRSGVRAAGRLAVGRRRTASRVATEYDAGSWSSVRSARAWETATSPEAFVAGSSDAPITARIHGRAVRLPRRDYYRWRLGAVRAIVAATVDGTELLELGCGFGMNLLSLAGDPRWTALRGLDISTTGIETGREIARHFGLAHVSFGEIDLVEDGHPGYKEVTDATVLTYFCLEQLPSAIERVIGALLNAGPARVVHVESAAGMLRPWRPFDAATALHVRSMDYQRTLVTTLDRLDREGALRVLRRERLGFGPTIHNEPALLVWEPA